MTDAHNEPIARIVGELSKEEYNTLAAVYYGVAISEKRARLFPKLQSLGLIVLELDAAELVFRTTELGNSVLNYDEDEDGNG